jgi:hypothetical protein
MMPDLALLHCWRCMEACNGPQHMLRKRAQGRIQAGMLSAQVAAS